jgi:hypothetical protein
MYTFDKATPNHVVGRIVGETSQHIAVAVHGNRVLAVHRNGAQYAVWYFGATMDDSGINVWGGEYFDAVQFEGGAYAAFQTAIGELFHGTSSYTARHGSTTVE